eukprot:g2827.t1
MERWRQLLVLATAAVQQDNGTLAQRCLGGARRECPGGFQRVPAIEPAGTFYCAPCSFGTFSFCNANSCQSCPNGAVCFGRGEPPRQMHGFFRFLNPEYDDDEEVCEAVEEYRSSGGADPSFDRFYSFVGCHQNKGACRGPRRLLGDAMLVNNEDKTAEAQLRTSQDVMPQLQSFQADESQAEGVMLRLEGRFLELHPEAAGGSPSHNISYGACTGTPLRNVYDHCLRLTHRGSGPNLLLSSGPHESSGPMGIWADDTSKRACAEGYAGRRCSRCEEGWGPVNSFCYRCSTYRTLPYVVLCFMVSLLFLGTRLLVHWETQKAHVRVNSLSIQIKEQRADGRTPVVSHKKTSAEVTRIKWPHHARSSSITKVMLSYCQIMQLALNFDLVLPTNVESSMRINQWVASGEQFFLQIGCTVFGQDFLRFTITMCWILPLFLMAFFLIFFWVRFHFESVAFRFEIPSAKSHGSNVQEEYVRRGLRREVADGVIDASEVHVVLQKLRRYTEEELGRRSVISTSALHVNEMIIQSNRAEYLYDEPTDQHIFTFDRHDGIRVEEFGRYYYKARRAAFLNKMAVAFFVVYFVLYSSVTLQAAYWFNCDDMGLQGKRQSFLAKDMEMPCVSVRYGLVLLTTSIPWAIGVACVLPIYFLFAYLQRMRDRLQRPDMLAYFGFIYSGYERQYYWWEFVILARKYVMVLLAASGRIDPVLATTLALLVVFTSLCLHLKCQPFEESSIDRLETFSLCLTAFTLFSLIIFHSTRDLDDGYYRFRSFLYWMIMMVNAMFLLTGLVLVITAQLTTLRVSSNFKNAHAGGAAGATSSKYGAGASFRAAARRSHDSTRSTLSAGGSIDRGGQMSSWDVLDRISESEREREREREDAGEGAYGVNGSGSFGSGGGGG